MRTSTKSAIGAITLGVLGLTYNLGQQAVVTTHTFSAPPVAKPTATGGSTSTPSTSATIASPKPSASTPSVQPPTTKPVSPSASASAPAATSKTADGSVVQSGYGTVQVRVTKTGTQITDVSMILSNATNGRAAAFSYLVQYAISANGSNFANLSGATYTSNAFKKSLDAALAKL